MDRASPRFHRADRALRVLSACNRAVIHSDEPSRLMQRVCDLIVDAGYRLAWIGLCAERGDVRPVARAGHDDGYVDQVRATRSDDERGRGPTGTAIRTNAPAIVRFIETDEHFTPWRAQALARGYRSALSVPLADRGAVFGVLAILSPEPDAFDDEETSLLSDLANDLAFGVKALETRAALGVSEARFRSLFEHAVEGIAVHELVRDASGRAVDYRILDANPAYERHTSVPVVKARGALASELYGAGEPPYLEAYTRVAETGEPHKLEVHFAPLGKHFEITAAKVGPDQFTTVFEDITERKRAAQALRLSEARTAALYELSQREFATEAELIDFALEKAVEVTGSRIGYYHFVQGDEINLTLFTWSRAAREGCTTSPSVHYALDEAGIWADCIRFRHPVVHNDYMSEPERKGLPDGHFPVHRHMSTCVIDAGKIVAVAGVGNKDEPYGNDDVRQLQLFMDGLWRIIAHKRAEESVKASARRWSATFDAIQDPLLVLSPSHEVVEANDAACMLFGKAREQVIGSKCYALFHGTDAPVPACPCEMAARTGRYSRAPLEQDGRSYELTAWPIPRDDGLAGFVHVIKDVTADLRRDKERANLQEQLRAGQKLEAIGKLAGGIAHDFNNLLSVIINYAEFATDSLHRDDPMRGDIDEITRAAQRAAMLTRQLLAFSRKQVMRPEVLSVNDVVTAMQGMLRRLIGEDIELEAKLDGQLPSIKADPSQLEQVVMNIVINARDAMPEGGKLTIETKSVELDDGYVQGHVGVSAGPHVMLSFTDTGAGMDEAVRERVFEPFFSTKPPGRGTGLGLSTVYGIVKQSGGNIWVYSEPGQGTSFKLYFPVCNAPGETRRPQSDPAAGRGTECILVVEDAEAVRKLAKRVLEAAGYTVLTASDGPSALVLCSMHVGDIDLVLTDVVMPQMSGKELVKRLTATRRSMRVLYMSGYTDNAIVHHGVLDEGTNFIGKPFNAAELTSRVREVLDEGKVR